MAVILDRFAESASARWGERQASDLLFILFALLVLALSVAIDRTFLIDQQNYVDNFSEAPTLVSLWALSSKNRSCGAW